MNNKNEVTDIEFQNAIWFGKEIEIYDSDEILLEIAVPIDFNDDVVSFETGHYLKLSCIFKIKD